MRSVAGLLKVVIRPRFLAAAFVAAVGFAAFAAGDGGVSDLGLAVLTAMVVAITIDLLFGEAILATVNGALANVPILQQAEAAGVAGIYMRSAHGGGPVPEMIEDIERHVDEANVPLRVMGVAAPTLFCDQRGQTLIRESQCRVDAILLDGACLWAQVRDGLEEGHITLEHIRDAVAFLGGLGGRAVVNPTDVPLPAFVVLTDQWAFVEPYPIAAVDGGLGGRTPMLRLRRGEPGYAIWEQTFDTIWHHSTLDKLLAHAVSDPATRHPPVP
jgi:hypothetical protein